MRTVKGTVVERKRRLTATFGRGDAGELRSATWDCQGHFTRTEELSSAAKSQNELTCRPCSVDQDVMAEASRTTDRWFSSHAVGR